MKAIRVILCKVNQEPVVREIEPTLSSLQSLVGGWLERFPCRDGVSIWCNEEGRLLNLPPNRAGFYGDFFIARHDDVGNITSVTDSDIAKVGAKLVPAPREYLA